MNSGTQLHDGGLLTSEQREARFVESIRQQLDASCDALDGRTLSRLHSIRSNALARRQQVSGLRRVLWPMSSLLAACLMVVAIGTSWLMPGASLTQTGQPEALEDIEILTANETLDFYEDYEFYQWLAQQ